MSDSGLSFYPAEEASQYELRVREPSQLELSIRTCRLLSSQALTQLTLATDHARTTAQGKDKDRYLISLLTVTTSIQEVTSCCRLKRTFQLALQWLEAWPPWDWC